MFSSVKTVEIHIFSCSNRVFARIFVRGSIHRVPSLCGIRSWSFLKVPDAPPWLNWRRNMTPCHVRAQVGLNSSCIPEPSSGVRESSLVGNIDQAGAWSQLSQPFAIAIVLLIKTIAGLFRDHVDQTGCIALAPLWLGLVRDRAGRFGLCMTARTRMLHDAWLQLSPWIQLGQYLESRQMRWDLKENIWNFILRLNSKI